MKRVILILVLTLAGCLASFVNAFWGLLLYTWYAFASPLELTYGTMEGTRLSFVIGVIVVLTTFNQRKQLMTAHPLTFLSFVFVGICFSSLAASGNFSVTFYLLQVELILKLVLAAMLVPVLLDSITHVRLYIQTIAVSAGVVAAYYGIFGLLAGSTNIQGPGRLGDNNAYAASITSVLPFIFYGGRYLSRRIPPLVRSIVTTTIFAGSSLAVVLTFSRGGFLSFIAIVFCLLSKLRGLLPRMLGWGILMPFLLLSAWRFYSIDPSMTALPGGGETSVAQVTFDEYIKRLMTLRGEVQTEESASGRLHFWKVAMEMGGRNPLFGVGLDRYRQEYEKYDFSQGRYGGYRAVHNLFFSVLAETGVVGLAVFLAMLATAFLAQIRAQRNARALSDRAAGIELADYASMTRIAFLGFLVASCFITTLYQEILWAMFSLSIALERLTHRMLRAERTAEA